MTNPLQKYFPGILVFNLIWFCMFSSIVSAANPPSVTVLTPVMAGCNTPLRVAVDNSGNIYSADPRAGGINKYNSAGQLLQFMPTAMPPQGIALTSSGSLIVSEGNYAALLDVNGTELRKLGSGVGQFKMANGIAVDSSGLIYVIDSLDDAVQVFSATGDFTFRFGTTGKLPGQFSMPTGIAYEKSANQLAVVDTLNGRIQFFDLSGNYQRSIGSYGAGPLKFTFAEGITFDYINGPTPVLNRMYIVDTFQNNVQVVDPTASGVYLSSIGSYGRLPGQLVNPGDVVFDSTGKRLIVTNGSGNLTLFGIDPIDAAGPDVTINSQPASLSTQNSGSFSFSSTDPTATFECSVDSGNIVACSSPFSYNLADGSHSFTVWAKDPAGNISINPATYSWTIKSASSITVYLTGTGSGSVNSNPPGLSCTSLECIVPFPGVSTVTLMATPSSTSLFTGWSGACSNVSGDCSVVLSGNTTVTANFMNVAARIPGIPPTYYQLVQAAYASSLSGGTIQMISALFTENLLLNQGISIILDGGYDKSYNAKSGMTTLQGTLTISTGTVVVDKLTVE